MSLAMVEAPQQVEVAVIGGGPAGLTAAIALAAGGVETALISKAPPADNRTTAPQTGIRRIDVSARLLRASDVMLEATEIGLEAFGYNIENRHLIAALDERAAALPLLQRIDAIVSAVEPDDAGVTIWMEDGIRISARLVVGADGRKSLCRTAAGIGTDHRSYPQCALTLNLGHARPHNNVSTEFHTETGPFTLVPLPGLRSSLVCVTDPNEAGRLTALDDNALSEEIERRSH